MAQRRDVVPGAEGGVILFIPGFQDTAAVWSPVIGRLEIPGWRLEPVTLAEVDTDDTVRGSVLQGYCHQVLAARDHLTAGGPVVVVGHSMGAQVAELVALALGGPVVGLVLIAPIPMRGRRLSTAQSTYFAAWAGRHTSPSVAEGRNLLLVNHSRDVIDTLAAGSLATPPQLAAQQLRAWSSGHPLGDGPSPVSAPVLLVGSDDRFVPRQTIRDFVAPRFAHVQIAHLPGAGHWPHVERPHAMAALLGAFVRARSRAPARPPHPQALPTHARR